MDAVDPVVLTNSRGDKVRRNLTALGIPLRSAEMLTTQKRAIRILGDVRQYDMSPVWPPAGEELAAFTQVDDLRKVDLRRQFAVGVGYSLLSGEGPVHAGLDDTLCGEESIGERPGRIE